MHLVDGKRVQCFPRQILGLHLEGMNYAQLGAGDALREILLAVFVHEKPDRPAMHSVDRYVASHEAMERLQHEAIAAKRNDDVSLRWRHSAITARQKLHRGLCFRCGAGDEPEAKLIGLGV